VAARIGRKVKIASVVFADRADAGRELAKFLALAPDPSAIVLALPRGGVPVGAALAESLGAPLEPVFVAKLPIPFSPEAGFGAVGIDGSIVLNDDLVRTAGIAPAAVDGVVERAKAEVRRRALAYSGTYSLPDVRGKRVYVTDDGLATGYTMIAAAKMVRKLRPSSLVLAVPVSPADSLAAVESHFDEAVCLIVQTRVPFAVASFYEDFHDLSDDEVLAVLEAHRPPK